MGKNIRSWLIAIGIGCLPSAAYAHDYCQYGKQSVLLLIDETTNFDSMDREHLMDGISKIFESLEVGDEIISHSISSSSVLSEKVFEGCYPGCPEGDIWSWATNACKGGLARQDALRFKAELAGKMKAVMGRYVDHPQSDILATIADLTKTYNGKNLSRLVVFSDLLENSKALPWPTIATSRFESLKPSVRRSGGTAELQGVKVQVFGFGRSHSDNREPLSGEMRQKVAEFWASYFKESGASDVRIGQRY